MKYLDEKTMPRPLCARVCRAAHPALYPPGISMPASAGREEEP